MSEETEAEAAELQVVGQSILDEVFPILDALDAEHPDIDAKFTAFVTLLHVMFEGGWTPDELIEEVQGHHDLWLVDRDKQDS